MTPKQQQFVDQYCISRNAADAARRAGYSEKTARSIGSELLTNPNVMSAIQGRDAIMAAELSMTRERVVNELQKAIGEAVRQCNPQAQIAGWREIAKLCGFYAPERHAVEVSASNKSLSAKYAAMSDEELLAIVEGSQSTHNLSTIRDAA